MPARIKEHFSADAEKSEFRLFMITLSKRSPSAALALVKDVDRRFVDDLWDIGEVVATVNDEIEVYRVSAYGNAAAVLIAKRSEDHLLLGGCMQGTRAKCVKRAEAYAEIIAQEFGETFRDVQVYRYRRR